MNSPESNAVSNTEHAVIVDFQYGSTDFDDLFALEGQVIAAIKASGTGYFDGNEVAIDGSHGSFWMYGPDADRLFDAIKPVLESSSVVSGVVAQKVYGTFEEGAKSVRVILGS